MRRSLSILGLACLASALHPDAGRCQSTARSLDIQPGARQNGMGAAGVALFGDATDGLWWNPAMLALGHRPSSELTYAKLLPGLAEDLEYWNGGASLPVCRHAGVGVGYTYVSYGDFTVDSYTPTEESARLGAAVALHPDLAIGAIVKRVHIDIAGGKTTGFDIGALYRHRAEDLTFAAGANVQNVGPQMRFTTGERYPLTRNVRCGLALQYTRPSFDTGYEFGVAFVLDRFQTLLPGGDDDGNYATTHYGGEVSLGTRAARLALRAGYYDDPEGRIQDPTFGGGLRFFGVTVDYASIPQASGAGLDDVQKWTLGYHFDRLR